jgi:serine/threonine protein kinase
MHISSNSQKDLPSQTSDELVRRKEWDSTVSLQKIAFLTESLFSKKMKLEKNGTEFSIKKYTWFNRIVVFFRKFFGMKQAVPKEAVEFIDLLKQVNKRISSETVSKRTDDLKVLNKCVENLEASSWIRGISENKRSGLSTTINKLKETLKEETIRLEEAHEKLTFLLGSNDAAKKMMKVFDDTVSGVIPAGRGNSMAQNHTVKKVKLYVDPTLNEWVMDIGGEKVAEGAMKKIKDVFRMTQREMLNIVRLTRKEKTEKSKNDFTRDILKEIERRKELKGIEKLMGITVITYISPKTGKVKERFFMEKSDGDLMKMLYGAGNRAYTRTPDLIKKVLPYCRDAFQALAGIHKKGFVSLDVKPENILTVGDEGRLTDLGFSEKLLDLSGGQKVMYARIGTPGYIAPELLKATYERPVVLDTSLDMWSAGVILLEIVDDSLGKELLRLGYGVVDANGDAVSAANLALEKGIDKIQKSLLKRKDPFYHHIARLLDSDPRARPSSDETYNAVAKYISSLSEK